MTANDKAADCIIKGIFTDRIQVDTKFCRHLAAIFTCVDVVVLVPSNRAPKMSDAEGEEAGLDRRFTKHQPKAGAEFRQPRPRSNMFYRSKYPRGRSIFAEEAVFRVYYRVNQRHSLK